MPQSERWVVTASGDRPLADVKKELAKAGFDVEQVLGEVGCITGSAGKDVVKRVRSIPGVADVSPEHAVDIGPPDAPVTW